MEDPQQLDGTGHLDLASEHGTDEDDRAFEQAIADARRRELLELEQLNK